MFRIQITGVSFSNHWCFEFEPVVFDDGSADGIAFVIQGGQLLTVVGGTADFHFLLRTDDDRVSFRFQLVDIIQHFVIVAVAQLQRLPEERKGFLAARLHLPPVSRYPEAVEAALPQL